MTSDRLTQERRLMQFRVAFFPTDLARSLSFYVDELGLRILESWDDPDSRGVLLEAGGGVIELLGPQPPGTTLATSGLSISIEVSDADALWTEVDRRGVAPLTAPVDQPWGHRNFSATDPDGVPVAFFHVLPDH